MHATNRLGEIATTKQPAAEFIGTFWRVLGGCGSAVLAANFGGDGNPLGIGLLGVSLAFGAIATNGFGTHSPGGYSRSARSCAKS